MDEEPKKETTDEMSARWEAAIAAAGALTEEQMRNAPAPRPKSIEELHAYVESLVNRPHDYGTCVYAMSLAAVAAFNYVASQLGVTGFQASCADMDILRHTRMLDGPFMLVKGEDALYPQYDILGRVEEWLDGDDFKAWSKAEAQKKLDNAAKNPVHPEVLAHWNRLAARG